MSGVSNTGHVNEWEEIFDSDTSEEEQVYSRDINEWEEGIDSETSEKGTRTGEIYLLITMGSKR